jgi:hypothetical protein
MLRAIGLRQRWIGIGPQNPHPGPPPEYDFEEVQEFKGSRDRGIEGSRVRGFEGSRVQGFKGSRVQEFKGARVQGFGKEEGLGSVRCNGWITML